MTQIYSKTIRVSTPWWSYMSNSDANSFCIIQPTTSSPPPFISDYCIKCEKYSNIGILFIFLLNKIVIQISYETWRCHIIDPPDHEMRQSGKTNDPIRDIWSCFNYNLQLHALKFLSCGGNHILICACIVDNPTPANNTMWPLVDTISLP